MSEIKPALSPEEWAEGSPKEWGRWYADWDMGIVDVAFERDGDRHALAALTLHGQPFGFTWEDVDLLKLSGSVVGDSYGPGSEQERFDSLADRIAALLPPREP